MMLGNRSLIPPSPRAGQQKLPSLHLPAIGARRPADTPRKKAAKRSSSNSSSSSSSSENDVPSQPAHEEHFLPTISTSVNRLGVPPVDYVSTRHNPMEVGVSGSSRRTSVSRASSRMFSARPSPAMSARKAATDAGSESQFPSPRRCGVQPYKNAWSITYLLKDGSVRERVSLQPPQLVRPADAPRGRCEWKNKLMTNYQRPTYDNIMRTINCDASQRGYHLRHVMYLDNDFAQFCVLTPNSSLCCISWLFQVIVDLGTSPRWGEAEFMYSTTPREEDVPRDHQKQQHEVPQHEEFLEDCTAAAEDESYGEVPVVDVDDVRQTRSYMTPPSPLRESEYSKESRSNRASPQQEEEEIEDISPQPEVDEVSTARKEAVVDEVADVPAEESTARAGRKEEEEEEVPVYDDVSVVSDHANADHFDEEQPPMSEREEDQLSYVPADVEEEDGDTDEEDAAILMEPARSPSPPAECVSPPIQVDEDDDAEMDDVVVEDDVMNEEPSPAEHQFGVVTDLASYNQSETGALMEVGEEYAESIAPEQAAVDNICLDMYEYLPSPVEQHRGTTLNLPFGSLTDVDDVKQVDEEHTEFAAADPAEVDDVHPDYEGAMDVGDEDVLPNEDAFAGAKVLVVPSPAEVMRGDVNDLGSQTSYQNAEMDMGEEDVPSMAGDAAAVDDICHNFLAQHRSPAECERGVTRAMDSQCSDSEEAMDVGEEDVPSDEDAFAGAKVLVVPSPAEVMRGDVNDLGSQTSYQNAEMDMGEEDVPSMAGDAAAVDDICHDFLAQQHRSPAECERGVTRAMDSQCSDSEEAMDVGEEDVPSDEDAFASARVLVVPSPTEMAAGATNVMGSQGSWQRRLLELGEEDVPSCGVGEEVSQRGCSQTSFISEEAEGNVSPVARHNQHMARSPRRYSGSLYASSHEPID